MTGPSLSKERLRTISYWAAPLVLMLALYWRAFPAWFQKDDFAWLGLRGMVHNASDLVTALFHPYAQGTIRTLTERIPFLAFPALFGLHPLPFRILAFVTCAGVLMLLASVTSRLTGSRAAGFLAAAIWCINNTVAIPLVWSSIYNELAWPFTLLLAFWLLLRYVETGERRFFIAQCVVFVVGFFVLETDVVYPAIASAFAILSPEARKRGLLKKVAPLFALSIVYTGIHLYVAPLPASGPYALHWDLKIFQTLTTYWGWALGPGEGRLIGIVSTFLRSISAWTLTAGLFVFLILRARRPQNQGPVQDTVSPAFFPLWFLIALAPLLPLRDHLTVEYLTAPALGLAMWGGWAIASAWRAGTIARVAAVALVTIYCGFSILVGQAHLRSFADRSSRIKTFVETVAEVARAHPGKTILLAGVNAELSDDAVHDRALDVFGVPGARIVSGDRRDDAAIKALHKGAAIVLDASSGRARDATAEFARSHKAEQVSSRIDFVDDVFDDQLGNGWYSNDGGFRWMGERATVMLAAPRAAGERLHVTGHGPEPALKSGPVTLQFSIDGVALGTARVASAGAFAFDFAIPSKFVGAGKIEVAIEVDRTFTLPPDPRVFGMVFVSFEVR